MIPFDLFYVFTGVNGTATLFRYKGNEKVMNILSWKVIYKYNKNSTYIKSSATNFNSCFLIFSANVSVNDDTPQLKIQNQEKIQILADSNSSDIKVIPTDSDTVILPTLNTESEYSNYTTRNEVMEVSSANDTVNANSNLLHSCVSRVQRLGEALDALNITQVFMQPLLIDRNYPKILSKILSYFF